MSVVPAERAVPTGSWLRRHRAVLLIGFALVLATALAVLRGGDSQYTASLDPDNADPGGARAVAQVLRHEGVHVDIVRDADGLARTRVDADTTVVVTSVGNLGATTADQLLASADDGRLVLVDPPVGTLGLFHLDEGTQVRPGGVRGDCVDERLDDLTIRVDRATAFADVPGSCFPVAGGALWSNAAGVSVLGAGQVLSNGEITRADNAAVALRLLGERGRLVWYVPDAADVPATDAVGIGSLLPDWLGPGLWLAALAVIALIGWRGRRLGPLATEPLPVAVTAIESTVSRGRLYRKVNDRAHAAEVLRRAARARTVAHLRLPRATAADPEALCRQVVEQSGLDADRVRHLLVGPDSPRTDKDLNQLANDLAELDREVRRP